MAGFRHNISPDRDDAHAAQRQQRDGDIVVSAIHDKIVAQKPRYLAGIRDIAAGLFDAHDIAMLAEPRYHIHGNRAARTPRDIVENDGRARDIRRLREMAIHSLGIRLIIIRRDAEQSICPHLGVFDALVHLRARGVGAAADDHRNAPCHMVDGELANLRVLFMRRRRVFARRPHHQNAVCSVFNMPIQKLSELSEIHAAILCKRRYQCHNRTFYCCHNFLLCP